MSRLTRQMRSSRGAFAFVVLSVFLFSPFKCLFDSALTHTRHSSDKTKLLKIQDHEFVDCDSCTPSMRTAPLRIHIYIVSAPAMESLLWATQIGQRENVVQNRHLSSLSKCVWLWLNCRGDKETRNDNRHEIEIKMMIAIERIGRLDAGHSSF